MAGALLLLLLLLLGLSPPRSGHCGRGSCSTGRSGRTATEYTPIAPGARRRRRGGASPVPGPEPVSEPLLLGPSHSLSPGGSNTATDAASARHAIVAVRPRRGRQWGGGGRTTLQQRRRESTAGRVDQVGGECFEGFGGPEQEEVRAAGPHLQLAAVAKHRQERA